LIAERYKFTAGYLVSLLGGLWHSDGPASPHRLLNATIYQYSTFTPLDGDETLLAKEEEGVDPLDFGTFDFSNLENGALYGLFGLTSANIT
jgi:hypothetical protein